MLEDWLHDYYEIDDEEAECLSEHFTAEAREYASLALGDDRDEAWWRCGDEDDIEIAAEYLYAAAHEN